MVCFVSNRDDHMTKKKHHGSSFDAFLASDGLDDEARVAATKKAVAAQIAAPMKSKPST
jgi:hypothetical protein